MKYTRDYRVGIEELGYEEFAAVKSLLVFMEDAACWHSAKAGYGVREVETKHRGWVVLDWKVRIHRIPTYEQVVSVSTWSRKMDGIRAFRDYEVKDGNGETLVSATSKWILTDTERRRPVRLTEDIVEAYETDGSCQAMDEEIEKLDYDEEKVENALTTHYTVRRSDIDVNRHVHNINYIDIAYEAMPEDVFFDFIRGVYKNFHILYKKEIMYGDEVVCKYYEDDGRHVIVMFVEDKMHAIMQFS
jgi:medium-chain acyl-[acyl-carrier-protein] hydrolase